MAAKMMEIVLVAMVMVILVPLKTMGQSNCQNEITSLSACYNYISASSSRAPSSQCCDRLENVFQRNAECLCGILNGGKLNKTRVLELPNACNLQIPSPTNCYSPPGSRGAGSPLPTPSGYTTKIGNSLMLSVLSAAGGIFITI
ncbi:hypothetical protein BUALT_Bualt13G0013900 [Buddleja alternifolia]|uniref:Bifunctional inhibitor/plant lipid transfer protein/seed storage helical domain-containing protein n=1 Tax=Buddleja alternifolia TaxID=168488 RepID=A0AAV6WR17_9LAMI|nr:hypothetical protein BUALT_Bualt13G0013900 [Buddleja alternifolia]